MADARLKSLAERINKSRARLRVVYGPGHLYAALSSDGTWIKLGFSTVLAERLVAINHDLLGQAPFTFIGATPSVFRAEQQIHRALSPFRQRQTGLSREMYPNTPDLNGVIRLLVGGVDRPPFDIDELMEFRHWCRLAAARPANKMPALAAFTALAEQRAIWWAEFRAKHAAKVAA